MRFLVILASRVENCNYLNHWQLFKITPENIDYDIFPLAPYWLDLLIENIIC